MVDVDEENQRKRRERLEAWKRKKELQQQSSGKAPTPPPAPPPVEQKPRPKLSLGLQPRRTGPEETAGAPIERKRTAASVFGADAADPPDMPSRARRIVDHSGPTPRTDTPEDPADPLEAYMSGVSSEMDLLRESAATPTDDPQRDDGGGGEASGSEDGDAELTPEQRLVQAAKRLSRKKDVPVVDHSAIAYEPFEKAFYIEPPDLEALSEVEVELLRAELDGIKVRGPGGKSGTCPRPCQKWTAMGLQPMVFDVIRRQLQYEQPTAIQAQAIPAIMSGLDVMGIAKTGSGKTLAFVLPMLRHVKAQRPLAPGEGPIGLVLTPTRELATQIFRECRLFARALGLRVACAYGGAPIKDQIAELKRGAEIAICTPGRLIDLLTANAGRVTNLQRVTFLVLDEADRMFDMGFEPQVMRIVPNVRPGRQTVLFSATFPRQMEALARKILLRPVEIVVGGRSVVCADVEQHVLVVREEEKFKTLLYILGEWAQGAARIQSADERPRALIFVDRQEAADLLLRDLLRRGYVCQNLHGGKEQIDRDATIRDFKDGVVDILVATSVAARGLDVRQLTLVVNYDCPNHMEDYVHRCGRTGRAGNKGAAYTLVSPDQEKYAAVLVKALTLSNAPVPADLQEIADAFLTKVRAGSARFASSGFGGKGLEQLDKERAAALMLQKQNYRATVGGDAADELGLEETPEAGPVAAADAPAPASDATASEAAAVPQFEAREVGVAQRPAGTQPPGEAVTSAYAYEIEINDYPQKARWRVTNKELVRQIMDATTAQIRTRGLFFAAGQTPAPGSRERKLHLLVEGSTLQAVDRAKNEIRRILAESTLQELEASSSVGPEAPKGRYNVLG